MSESSDNLIELLRGKCADHTGALYLSSFGAGMGVDSVANKWNALLAPGRFARTQVVRVLRFVASSLRP